MADDRLESLKNRKRAIVPPRDTSVMPAPVEVQESPIPQSQGISIPRYLETEIQTKQTTMRLEQGMSDRLQALCRRYNVSREVLIEALLVRFEDAPEIQDAVVAEAQKRQEVRMQAANRKRAQTMIEKFGQVT